MTIIVLENQARSSFSIPALINIGEKLFDIPRNETAQEGQASQEQQTAPGKKE